MEVLYYDGQGVKQSYTKAKEYYIKSCDFNDGLSCHNLGVLYQNGYGDVKRPHTKAKEYFSKASNLELDPDCKNIRF
ncbi:hypothetical protein BFG05_07530 [Campylobacter pinnipediorum subsp. pinnipediorum]|nr:hypothetical protein BFG05_07530 [Campylobacter pinnipediorum subsp. pinnipediorum]